MYKHSTPHQSGGKYELVATYRFDSDHSFDATARAAPFAHVDVDLRAALGWRRNRRAYA